MSKRFLGTALAMCLRSDQDCITHIESLSKLSYIWFSKIECSKWLDNYIKRRYGKSSTALHDTWNILLQTCYKNDGYHENEVGSAVAARPQLMPVRSGPSRQAYDCHQSSVKGRIHCDVKAEHPYPLKAPAAFRKMKPFYALRKTNRLKF